MYSQVSVINQFSMSMQFTFLSFVLTIMRRQFEEYKMIQTTFYDFVVLHFLVEKIFYLYFTWVAPSYLSPSYISMGKGLNIVNYVSIFLPISIFVPFIFVYCFYSAIQIQHQDVALYPCVWMNSVHYTRIEVQHMPAALMPCRWVQERIPQQFQLVPVLQNCKICLITLSKVCCSSVTIVVKMFISGIYG